MFYMDQIRQKTIILYKKTISMLDILESSNFLDFSIHFHTFHVKIQYKITGAEIRWRWPLKLPKKNQHSIQMCGRPWPKGQFSKIKKWHYETPYLSLITLVTRIYTIFLTSNVKSFLNDLFCRNVLQPFLSHNYRMPSVFVIKYVITSG